MKKICFCILFFVVAFMLTAQEVTAREVTIDMRYNVLRPEPSRDYFNWISKNRSIQDSYDAVTGASAARSTREFDSIRFDTMTDRRYTLPRGIRHILLFPIASRQYTDNFHLIAQEEGERLRICFIVYGTVYQILTDDNKRIDIRTSCSLAEGITESNSLVSPLRTQYVKTGGNVNDINALDWEKINFVPDTADPNASRRYAGILTANYSEGVLTIKGVLTSL
ncbi:MAG: hypothetical protein LBI74_08270 [Synergistaceae bacterium]|jgi:hypothetical protein|nr:hypothetical protein [Synergistaceae bacterium]